MKPAETSILAVNWQQSANPMTEAAYGITRVLESEGSAFTWLDPSFKIHRVAPFRYSPVTCHAPATDGWYDAQATTLRFAENGRGQIDFCTAVCQDNKAYVWGHGTGGGQGMNPSGNGTNATTRTNPFDLTLAKKLNTYFEPGGTWWNIPR